TRGTSYMFVTGPNVVKTVTHEDVTMERLGGADTHAGTSGVAHFVHESEPACLAAIRELFAFIPQNNLDDPPRGKGTDPRDRRGPARGKGTRPAGPPRRSAARRGAGSSEQAVRHS